MEWDTGGFGAIGWVGGGVSGWVRTSVLEQSPRGNKPFAGGGCRVDLRVDAGMLYTP